MATLHHSGIYFTIQGKDYILMQSLKQAWFGKCRASLEMTSSGLNWSQVLHLHKNLEIRWILVWNNSCECFLTRERENIESQIQRRRILSFMFAESKNLPIVHSSSNYSINCMYCLALSGEEFAVCLKARMWLKEDRSLVAGKLQQVTSFLFTGQVVVPLTPQRGSVWACFTIPSFTAVLRSLWFGETFTGETL